MNRVNGTKVEKKRVVQGKELHFKKKGPATILSDNGTIELCDSISIAESSSIESPVFARLQPLDQRVDPIDNGNQYYDFARLIAVGGDMSFLISRQQFRIERDRKTERTYLIDTSRNGTFINQERYAIGERVLLNHCDVISMGKAELYFWIYDERRYKDLPQKLANKYVVSNVELGQGGYSKAATLC
ncbi:unnamed protein product, partial [Mesorhabditis belari]|uniref:FHA domain-containing protein n=1 Tax=Mesorhabditis belari TaxID=2138241 RepID=A0AAF3J393_9BILA